MSEETESSETRLDGEFPWVAPDTDWDWLEIPANPSSVEATEGEPSPVE